jgi:hypothetical protein
MSSVLLLNVVLLFSSVPRLHFQRTYSKINGAIRRHFGKQMNEETKLRIHNITAKAG